MDEFTKRLLYNEMLAASDAASTDDPVPLVLGDQPIEEIGERVKELGLTTLKQLTTPTGLTDVIKETTSAMGRFIRSGESLGGARRLGAGDFLDPKLVLAAPISISRYLAAILLKGPNALRVPLLCILGLMVLNSPVTASDIGGAAPAADAAAASVEELLRSAVFAGLEVLLLGRIFLIGLLEERNVVIADNIRRECEKGVRRNAPLLTRFFGNPSVEEDDAAEAPTIIAVLGMAHCNGVAQILREGSE